MQTNAYISGREAMRQKPWAIILLALLLGACGGTAASEQPAAAPTQAAAISTPAPTVQPEPTEDLFRAEPTAPIDLPPTSTPAQAASAATAAPPEAIEST